MNPRVERVLLLLLCALLMFGCTSGNTHVADDLGDDLSVPAPPKETTSNPSDEPPPLNPKEGSPRTVAASVDGIITPGEYDQQQTVAQVSVSWSIEGENLRMAMSAPGTGYVSVGFDPEFRKEGGNYIIGYVEGENVVVRDHVGTRGNLHEADTELGGENNILAFSGTEIDGQTTLEFVIPLDSGDPMDQPLIPGSRHVLLVAYQKTRDDLISIHSRHGVAQIEL